MNDPFHIPRPTGTAQSTGYLTGHATHPPRPLAPAAVAPARTAPVPSPSPSPAKPQDDLSSLAIVDEPGTATVVGSTKIQAFGVRDIAPEREFKRQSNLTGNGAVHVRTFHGHLHDEGLARLDNRINDWLEAHPQVEVKFATTTIGLWDGKTKDQAMIINIWY